MLFSYIQFFATQGIAFFERSQFIFEYLLPIPQLRLTVEEFFFVLLITNHIGEMLFDVNQLILKPLDTCIILSDSRGIGSLSTEFGLLGCLQFFTAFILLLPVKFDFSLNAATIVIEFPLQPKFFLFITLSACLKATFTIGF